MDVPLGHGLSGCLVLCIPGAARYAKEAGTQKLVGFRADPSPKKLDRPRMLSDPVSVISLETKKYMLQWPQSSLMQSDPSSAQAF